MTILGIETSCDETGAAVVSYNKTSNALTVLSNVIATSLEIHATTGGIIPEIAAREQVKYILPVIEQALTQAGLSKDNPAIDAIAVTYGPGLIGSLLVGVETARTLSYIWDKPLIPVNHLYGHIYANWLNSNSESIKEISLPAIILVVSGGHTDLLLMKSHADITVIGGTRDDAAGEAFDKIGRLLNLSYPAGPVIEKKAKLGDAKRFRFPRPLHDSKDFDFSFSGLKTAVYREVQKQNLNVQTINDISAGTQAAIIDSLVTKTMQAAKYHDVQSVIIGGGVSASQTLRENFQTQCDKVGISFFAPQRKFSTDNAAMIAAAAIFRYNTIPWQDVTANPELYY